MAMYESVGVMRKNQVAVRRKPYKFSFKPEIVVDGAVFIINLISNDTFGSSLGTLSVQFPANGTP